MRKWIIRFTFGMSALLLLIFAANNIIIQTSAPLLFDDINKVPCKEVALVLGTSKKGKNGQLNPYFQYRMEAAAELYHMGKVKKILVSGDNHIKNYNEPQDTADCLVALGVPKLAITLDYAGFRTLDSVIRSKKVFNCQSLIIVTQKFHNQRAVYAANQIGINAVGYNSKDIQSKSNYTHYREFISKFVMILDLHFFHTQPKFL